MAFEGERVNIVLASSAGLDLSRLDRHFYTSSSCCVCGKTSIGALETVGCPVIPRDRPLLDPFSVYRMPEKLRSRQQVFDRTGGLHAGIGAIAAVGAPSSLAVHLAEQFGITLIGFARGERFNVYSGGFRLRMPSAAVRSSQDHAAENPSTKL